MMCLCNGRDQYHVTVSLLKIYGADPEILLVYTKDLLFQAHITVRTLYLTNCFMYFALSPAST